jgi:WhiB family redox-sensing transcriptional regulator
MTAIAAKPTHIVGRTFLGSNDPSSYARDAADWQERAVCRGMDTATFYAREGQRAASLREHERRAKEICSGCPVIQDCLDYALAAREPWGVWGGMTVDERNNLLARLPQSPARPAAVAG